MSWKFEFDIFEVRTWMVVPGVRVAFAVLKSRVSSVKVMVREGCD